MAKAKFRPWDPADRIGTAEDAILFLKISLEDYDSTFNALIDCNALTPNRAPETISP